MANLFRQYYGKAVKDMRNLLQKEINTGAWKATNRFINVLSKVNIIKILKPSVIESGMKYCLSTGNWGIKNSRGKQGIAQVLNRLTYNATMSHMRRINTPVEKTGKLVQPRKLHATQWGIICPSETPDGASVGLVKNMALTVSITMAGNSAHVRHVLREELGVMTPAQAAAAAAGGEGSGINTAALAAYQTATMVFVNGSIVGLTREPASVVADLRERKRRGEIGVYTAVCWNVRERELRVSTEHGRCVRPVYIVDDGNRLRLDAQVVADLLSRRVTWMHVVTGYVRESGEEVAPVVEYVDVDEVGVVTRA